MLGTDAVNKPKDKLRYSAVHKVSDDVKPMPIFNSSQSGDSKPSFIMSKSILIDHEADETNLNKVEEQSEESSIRHLKMNSIRVQSEISDSSTSRSLQSSHFVKQENPGANLHLLKQNSTLFKASRLQDFLQTIKKDDQKAQQSRLPIKPQRKEVTLSTFIDDFVKKKHELSTSIRSPQNKKTAAATPSAAAIRSPNLKTMLKTGQLRHQIIKDHQKKDLNLQSIDFSKKYNIQDILSNRGDGKITFAPSKQPDSRLTSPKPLKLAKHQIIQSVLIYDQASKGKLNSYHSTRSNASHVATLKNLSATISRNMGKAAVRKSSGLYEPKLDSTVQPNQPVLASMPVSPKGIPSQFLR